MKQKKKRPKKTKQHSRTTKRPGDHFYKEAKKQGFLARSVFKLQEIDKKYRLFPDIRDRREPFNILDLGCAPGSWLQYICEKLKKDDRIIGIDPSRISFSDEKLTFLNKNVEDVTSDELFDITGAKGFDLVLSDMAPKTSGIKVLDQERSLGLCRSALKIAITTLKKDGDMVVKIFQGPDVKNFINKTTKYFKEVKSFKPVSSRKESFEIYMIAKGFINHS